MVKYRAVLGRAKSVVEDPYVAETADLIDARRNKTQEQINDELEEKLLDTGQIIDSELSVISKNPVQNKVITEQVQALLNQNNKLSDTISSLQNLCTHLNDEVSAQKELIKSLQSGGKNSITREVDETSVLVKASDEVIYIKSNGYDTIDVNEYEGDLSDYIGEKTLIFSELSEVSFEKKSLTVEDMSSCKLIYTSNNVYIFNETLIN